MNQERGFVIGKGADEARLRKGMVKQGVRRQGEEGERLTPTNKTPTRYPELLGIDWSCTA